MKNSLPIPGNISWINIVKLSVSLTLTTTYHNLQGIGCLPLILKLGMLRLTTTHHSLQGIGCLPLILKLVMVRLTTTYHSLKLGMLRLTTTYHSLQAQLKSWD